MIGILVVTATTAAGVTYLWYAARRGPAFTRSNLMVVGGLVGLGFIANIIAAVAYHRFRMGQGSAYTTGQVSDARRKQKLYRYTVAFRVSGQKYLSYYSAERPLFPGCEETSACLGQPLRVHYALHDPEVNEVVVRP